MQKVKDAANYETFINSSPLFVFGKWLPIFLFRYIPVRIFRLAKRIPKAITFVFVRIHSELRLLCAVDSFIGALTGYLAALHYTLPFSMIVAVMVGSFVGILVGVISYKLVSQRLLKLVN